MTLYNIFNTKEEAEAAQAKDYSKFLVGVTNAAYIASTERWADVIEMVDGRWGYAVYPDSDHVYSTIDYTPTPETTVDL